MALTFGSVFKAITKPLGGIFKTAVKQIPVVGPALSFLEDVKRNPTAQKIISTPIPGTQSIRNLGAPRMVPVSGGTIQSGVTGGGSSTAPAGLPQLPMIPGTAMVSQGGVRGGGSSTAVTVGQQGGYGHYSATGRWIRTTSRGKQIRRMNPANGRAIGRAARRIKAAEKMFRKVLSITHPGGGHHTIKPKFGRKK